MIEWINFISLLLGIGLFSILYTISLQPKKRSGDRGESAWKECKRFRTVAGALEFLIVINTIMWIWFPLPLVQARVHSNLFVGIGTGLSILGIGGTIMIKGIMDAGKETYEPSEDTEMYGGIYKHIRHPQSLGEFPMFVAVGFIVNSWFLVILLTAWIVVYLPIMIHIEEADLVRRFGNAYKRYQETTGALFPKLHGE
ncbi:hypothetical protein GF325_07820 [Candidatus Bathyarchaeota archaeon]|nr:hypothetical protein [Candidatus Bathyarchaeota archaeon]